MHELSIAEAVIDIATEHARGRRVARIDVKVGHLRQVVPDALEFAFTLAAEGTVAEGAELSIEQVPVVGECKACDQAAELRGFPLACPACGSLEIEIVSGEELCVDALDVVDAQPVCEEAV